ncbi:TnsA endonuclease C-terminal domain-containing protein [Clostridium sp. LQ25]|uniref:TnsA endonuclease C-terminal domain-containing protein n=1 Tax=Clostridium sp. LQ25 TaxID=2992805 RepID=UPI00224F8E68|nr:TnsA endonuclease C-terminal domain-containing protein [Clostridium sp. LQ25]UZT06152.1 TnsA endonuclease C-terminal domain-containing protein [Clostridium sp. LQ25]
MTLKVTTFSSKGRATRIYSHKTKRIHHLQSDNQLKVFLLFEWIDSVKDIKENMELKDLETTIYNVENLRLDKFTNKETGQLYQLHTNFLIKIFKKEKYEEIAVSVKSLSELERKTVIEKLEIERRYWKTKNIKFYLITEKEIDKQVVENIKWVREALIDKSIENKAEIAEKLYYFIQENKDKILQETLDEFDAEEGLEVGTALFMFRYLIAIKEIYINMKEKIHLNKYIKDIVQL